MSRRIGKVNSFISVLVAFALCFSMVPKNVVLAVPEGEAAEIEIEDISFDTVIKDETLVLFDDILWFKKDEVEVELQLKDDYQFIEYGPEVEDFDIENATKNPTKIIQKPTTDDEVEVVFYLYKEGENSKIYKLTLKTKKDDESPSVELKTETMPKVYDGPEGNTYDSSTDSEVGWVYLPEDLVSAKFEFKISDKISGLNEVKIFQDNNAEENLATFDSESGICSLELSESNEVYNLEDFAFSVTDKAGNEFSKTLYEVLGDGFPKKLHVTDPPKIIVNHDLSFENLIEGHKLVNGILWFGKDERSKELKPKDDYRFTDYNKDITWTGVLNLEEYTEKTLDFSDMDDTNEKNVNYYLFKDSKTILYELNVKYKRDVEGPTVNFSTSSHNPVNDVNDDKTNSEESNTPLFIIDSERETYNLTFKIQDGESGLDLESVELLGANNNEVIKTSFDKGRQEFTVSFGTGTFTLKNYSLVAKDNAGNEVTVSLNSVATEEKSNENGDSKDGEGLKSDEVSKDDGDSTTNKVSLTSEVFNAMGEKFIVIDRPVVNYLLDVKSEIHPKYYKLFNSDEKPNTVTLSIEKLDDEVKEILKNSNIEVYKQIDTYYEGAKAVEKIPHTTLKDLLGSDKNSYTIPLSKGLHSFIPLNEGLFNHKNEQKHRQEFIVDDSAPTFKVDEYANEASLDFAGITVFPKAEDATVDWTLKETGYECSLYSYSVKFPYREKNDEWQIELDSGENSEEFEKRKIEKKTTHIEPLDTLIYTKDMTVDAVDMAGNKLSTNFFDAMKKNSKNGKSAPTAFFVDSANPTINLTFDKKEVVPGYFNEDANATFTVYEASFIYLQENEPERVVAHITRDGKTRDICVRDFKSAGENTWKYDYPLSIDAQYTFKSDDGFIDIAGKKFASSVNKSVILDTVAPSISVTFDNNDSSEPTYFNAGRTATVVVRDKNIDPSLIKMNISNGVAFGWRESESGEWTANVGFSREGVCRIFVDAVDRATNRSNSPFDSDVFTLDFTAPSVSIQRIENAHAYGDVCAPLIVFSDTNFDSSRTTYKITGAVHGEGYFTSNTEETDTSLTLDFADIEHELENDDVYTIEAEVEDKAGNKATTSKRFSVNRFGSNYILSDDTKNIFGKHINFAPQIEVTEINVSGLIDDKTSVMVAKGSDVVSLNSEGYEKRRNEDAAWDECTYVLPEETFDTDDYYRILFSSLDTATNVSSNAYEYKNETRDGSAPVEFVLDTTNPVSSFLTLEDEKTHFAPSVTEHMFLDDNLDVDSANLVVDGETIAEYSTEELKSSNIKTLDFPAKDRPQSLQLTTKDEAGNVSFTKLDGVVITNNPIIYWFYTPALFYPSIAGLLVLIALVCLCVWVHKKNKKYVEMSMSNMIGIK